MWPVSGVPPHEMILELVAQYTAGSCRWRHKSRAIETSACVATVILDGIFHVPESTARRFQRPISNYYEILSIPHSKKIPFKEVWVFR